MREIRKNKDERWSIDLTDESEVSKHFKGFEINFSKNDSYKNRGEPVKTKLIKEQQLKRLLNSCYRVKTQTSEKIAG